MEEANNIFGYNRLKSSLDLVKELNEMRDDLEKLKMYDKGLMRTNTYQDEYEINECLDEDDHGLNGEINFNTAYYRLIESQLSMQMQYKLDMPFVGSNLANAQASSIEDRQGDSKKSLKIDEHTDENNDEKIKLMIDCIKKEFDLV